MAWRLISELVRRHPARLWVRTETHSIGSEQAFLVDMDAPSNPPLGFFGLPGSAAERWASGARMEWRDAYDGLRDPRDWLADFEQLIGLDSPPHGLPASTPSSLAIRLTGQFLVSQIGSRHAWIAGGPHRWHNSARFIPAGATWINDDARPYPFEPIFVGHRDADAPVLALSTSGHLWTVGAEFDLAAEYAVAGSIPALLLRVLLEWMV